jgi:hypothetical protein
LSAILLNAEFIMLGVIMPIAIMPNVGMPNVMAPKLGLNYKTL